MRDNRPPAARRRLKPADWYEAHDVELRTGSSVVAIDTAAHSVVLDSGQELEYQKVLLTTGGRNGILADELCRASAADVYAAGDVANHLHPVLGRIRVEHYNSAEHHGAAAARAMLGSTAPFDYIHNFWSDQYEHTLQYAGHAEKWDDFVVRGSLQERKLVGFYLLAGVVRAAVGFDRGGDPEWEPDSEMAACASRRPPRPARSPVAHRRAHELAVAGAVTLSACHGRWLVSLTRRTAANS